MIRKSELTIVSGSNVISCSLSRIDSGPDAVSDVLSGMVCGSDAVACVLSCIASSAQTSSAGVALRPGAEHRAIDRRNRFDKIYPPFLIGVGLISSLFGNILPKQNPMDLHRAFFFSMHADHKHGCGLFFCTACFVYPSNQSYFVYNEHIRTYIGTLFISCASVHFLFLDVVLYADWVSRTCRLAFTPSQEWTGRDSCSPSSSHTP